MKFKESLTENNNILTHLCDGLETFLGFNPSSKGYDGTGIVYSDLDRLCDAVMGFLSGVLSNIQGHLGQHKGTLNDAIRSLNDNKHAGKKGFNEAIGKVVAGVRGYNKGVKKSNDQVKQIVTDLQDYTKTGGELLNDIQNIQVDDESKDKGFEKAKKQVEERLQECRQKAETFTNNLDVNVHGNKHKDAINDFNDKLRDTLENVRATVAYESGRLETVRQQEEREFNATKETIKATLQNMKSGVDCKIDAQIQKFVSKLREEVEKILTKLKNVEKHLRQYINSLEEWMIQARQFVSDAEKQIGIILAEVNEDTPGKNPHLVKEAAEHIKLQAQMIHGAAKHAEERVKTLGQEANEKAKELDGWKQAAGSVVTQAKEKCAQIGKMVETGSAGNGDIHGIAKEMKEKADRLRMAAEKVKDEIGGLVRDAHQKVTLLDTSIRTDLYVLKREISGGIVDYVTALVQRLMGSAKKADSAFGTKGVSDLIHQLGKDSQFSALTAWLKSANGSGGDGVKYALESFLSWIKALKLHGKQNPLTNALTADLAKPVEQQLKDAVGAGAKVDVNTANFSGYNTYVEQVLDPNGKPAQPTGQLPIAINAINSENVKNLVKENGAEMNHNTFGEPFSRITTKLEEIAGLVDSSKNTANTNDGIQQYLDDLKSKGLETGTGGTWTPLGGTPSKGLMTIKGDITVAIDNIGTQVATALTDIDKLNTEAEIKFYDLTNKLSQLCADIRNAAGDARPEGLKSRLNEFKKLIDSDEIKVTIQGTTQNQTGLKKIHEELANWRSKLQTGPLADIDKLVLYLTTADKHFAKFIKDEIHQDIKKAEAALTSHARKTYVESIKFLLAEFVGKLTRELRELPREIDADLEIGFKGFMKYFHVPLTNDLRRDDYTVHKLSYAFKLCFGPWQMLLEREIDRVDKEERKRKHRAPTESESLYVKKLKSSFGVLDEVLMHFAGKNGYDHETYGKLDKLEAEIAALKPDTFAEPSTAILDSIAAGLTKFVSEMRSVYISKYDSEVFTKDLMYREDVASTDGPKTTITLTQYGKNCCKVFLSILPMVAELMRINEMCMDSKLSKKAIFKSRQKNPVAAFFKDNGYDVPSSDVKQEGYMRCGLTALAIADKLSKDGKLCKYMGKREGTLNDLLGHLHDYYYVCHYATFSAKKHPSSIYDMLLWLTGLSHNRVHHELTLNGFSGLFEKPKETDDNAPNDGVTLQIDVDGSEAVGPSVKLEDDYSLDAYPTKISATGLAVTLTDVCHYAEETLIAILGRGHSGGRYVCDFNTNVDGFVYPSDGSKCLDLLAEILLRLFHQLQFLYKQCTYPTQLGGWLDCHYGRDVGGSNWICNTMQCPNQKAGQTHNQTCDQKCNQTPKCGLKSPLQSFLEDGLPGFMPHPYGKSDCKMKCDAPNHFGKPCKTPMGFADLTTVASINGTGKRIKDALHQFCGKDSSPLTKLCGDLVCLLQRPPQTLGDMFAFYYRFINGWGGDGRQHRLDAFNDAIAKAHFEVPYNELDVHSIFKSTHSSKSAGHTKGDLLSLVCSTVSNEKCGLYLSSISNDISGVYSSKYADKYLSWIVYITETFYDLLKKLFDDCNKHCGGDKPKCRIAKCPSTCTVTKQHTKSDHADSCNSIANCRTTLPTLCRYGFTIGNLSKLSGKDGVSQKRTCNDFCNMLGNVVKEGNALHKLAHEIIPEFLFKIRAPFIWLNVALWFLSLLYLLHIMVIRLDLLHIESHLRSPSSHRIAAQSLLAAARVGKLAKITYLQP